MSQDAREQDRHNASVMSAFAEGKEIRMRNRFAGLEWMQSLHPTWDWVNYEYEVKPEERKPREIQAWINPDYPNIFRDENYFNYHGSVSETGWTLTTFVEKVLPETETE